MTGPATIMKTKKMASAEPILLQVDEVDFLCLVDGVVLLFLGDWIVGLPGFLGFRGGIDSRRLLGPSDPRRKIRVVCSNGGGFQFGRGLHATSFGACAGRALGCSFLCLAPLN